MKSNPFIFIGGFAFGFGMTEAIQGALKGGETGNYEIIIVCMIMMIISLIITEVARA